MLREALPVLEDFVPEAEIEATAELLEQVGILKTLANGRFKLAPSTVLSKLSEVNLANSEPSASILNCDACPSVPAEFGGHRPQVKTRCSCSMKGSTADPIV